jgi:hypothetical protein
VNGNPLEDISALARGSDSFAAILKDGKFHKRAL